MSAAMMRQLRLRVQLSQTEMAARLGFSARGYQELEAERTTFAPRHLAVLERVSLTLALERNDITLALPSIADDVRQLIDQADERRRPPQDQPSPPAIAVAPCQPSRNGF